MNKAGVLLAVVPDHAQWDDFLLSVKNEWQQWHPNLCQYPACLVLIYAGLAFYEYDDNTLWPQFAIALGSTKLSGNQQQEINRSFAAAAAQFGLKLRLRNKGTDFIGSAINYIGVPLSLWDGFLDICEWALWRRDWGTLSGEEWNEAIVKRTGSRQRLKKYLTDNQGAAKNFIQEMLDAREILAGDENLQIDSLAQASILRSEYFDEVPETAEFLRPLNPESLSQDRARLVWNEQRRQIYLQLPSVGREKLPATWHVGESFQGAAPDPDVLPLNSAAFRNPLLLTLKSGTHSETQRFCGIDEWGLFDLESGGRLVNFKRDELPLKSYMLVSQKKIDIQRDGFDENENPLNEQFELADGSTCFVTRLWPTGKLAEVRIKGQGRQIRAIHFKTRDKIDARFIAGQGKYAGYFERINDFVKVEKWPILCVSIPHGYFRSNETELSENFKVRIDDKLADGCWLRSAQDADREYYFWKWGSSRPVIEKVKTGKVTNLRDLRSFFHTPSLKGTRMLSVSSPEFNFQQKIYKDEPKPGMEKCWEGLPGAFLPMFLLCQSTEGMKWDDLMLVKDVVSPDSMLSYYYLKKYADHGYIEQRRHRWLIAQMRAELKTVAIDKYQLDYCGDPSVLWGLYRRLYHQMQGASLPVVEVINKRGEVPYLRTVWPLRLRDEIVKYVKQHRVVIGKILWTH